MDQFFELLKAYLNPKEDFVTKWDELNQLLTLMARDNLTPEEQNIATFLVLQAELHIFSSCHYKAYDLANDLRNKVEEHCINIIRNLPKITSDALAIEIKQHRIYKEEYSNLVNNSKSSITISRNWNFYVLKNNGKAELFAFNLVSPNVILKKELNTFEENIISDSGFFPICSDIADKLRFEYWLKNDSVNLKYNQSDQTTNQIIDVANSDLELQTKTQKEYQKTIKKDSISQNKNQNTIVTLSVIIALSSILYVLYTAIT